MNEITLDSQHAKLADKPDSSSQPTPTQKLCTNCDTPLNGPFCSQCGQPAKSIIRFFGSLITELLEDIIQLDSRALRTFVALLFRPGFLTLEYIKGRRFSYVPPLRLFLITIILLMFIAWIMNKLGDPININDESKQLSEEQIAEVQASLDRDLADLPPEKAERIKNQVNQIINASDKDIQSLLEQVAQDEQTDTPDAIEGADSEPNTELALNVNPDASPDPQPDANPVRSNDNKTESELATVDPDELEQRLEQEISDELEQAADEVEEATEGVRVNIGPAIEIEDGKFNVDLPFLDDSQNRSLETTLDEKFEQAKQDPRELIEDTLDLIPKSMLFFIPLFALLMKLTYPFARRYYIEHLIHAFHGHSFLYVAIMLAMGLNYINGSLESSETYLIGMLGRLAGILEVALYAWIPIYFLLSLRRVYQQNWFLTFFKWSFFGIAYTVLFSISGFIVFIISLLIN